MNYHNAEPEMALNIRAKLFSKQFPVTRRRWDLGSPCEIKTKGRPDRRALLISRAKNRDGICQAMTDDEIVICVGYELINPRTAQFFIPMRFWMPYGIWTEDDGSKVLFSRDYCPLWKIQDDCTPVQDDPDRWVSFISKGVNRPQFFFDGGSFCQPVDEVRGLKILQKHQVLSVPKLVEWLPKCLEEKKDISKFKRWP